MALSVVWIIERLLFTCLVGGMEQFCFFVWLVGWGRSFQSVSYRSWTPFFSHTGSSSLRTSASCTACLHCSCMPPPSVCLQSCTAHAASKQTSCRVPTCLCCAWSCTSLLLAASTAIPHCQQLVHASLCLSLAVVEIESMFKTASSSTAAGHRFVGSKLGDIGELRSSRIYIKRILTCWNRSLNMSD